MARVSQIVIQEITCHTLQHLFPTYSFSFQFFKALQMARVSQIVIQEITCHTLQHKAEIEIKHLFAAGILRKHYICVISRYLYPILFSCQPFHGFGVMLSHRVRIQNFAGERAETVDIYYFLRKCPNKYPGICIQYFSAASLSMVSA